VKHISEFLNAALNTQASVARSGAEDGIERAVRHADAQEPGWSDVALMFLERHARRNAAFMTEEVRVAAEEWGLAAPPYRRAWGAVVRRAVKAGFIAADGFSPQRSASCHCSPKTVWRSLIFMGVAA
jgi:hypothetical protein